MAKSSGGGGWRTGGGGIATISSVRNTKSVSLKNVKDCSWSRNIINACYSQYKFNFLEVCFGEWFSLQDDIPLRNFIFY